MFFQSTFFSITSPSLSLSMNFPKCAVVFLGHLLDLCAGGFPLLSVVFAYFLFYSPWEPGPHLSPFLLFPSCSPTDVFQRHLLEDWQVFWRQTENIREESDLSAPLKPEPCTELGWVRSVLKATSPRTGIWGQHISEDTGHCPPLGKASSPAASGDEASSGAMGSGRGRQAGSPADRLKNQSAVGRGGPPGSAASSIVRLLDSVANRPTPA